MYNVGDHVVYPMHGAGVIVAIEEREVLGEKQEYYIMALPIGDMKVMIPLNLWKSSVFAKSAATKQFSVSIRFYKASRRPCHRTGTVVTELIWKR